MWKRTVLELGGYNPMIILDDTELQYAVDSAIFGAFFHQGHPNGATLAVWPHLLHSDGQYLSGI